MSAGFKFAAAYPPRADLSGAINAAPAHLDNRTDRNKAADLGFRPDAGRYLIVIDMGGGSAIITHEEDAIMQAAGVRVRQIGIAALHPGCDMRGDEQVQYAVDGVGSDPATKAAAHASRCTLTTWRPMLSDEVERTELRSGSAFEKEAS